MSPDSTIMSPADFAAWEARADVLLHFYAYHYFDQGSRHACSLDLINLDDADVQYYNRISDQTRRFSSQNKLANYLLSPPDFKIPLCNQNEFGKVLSADVVAEIKFMATKKHDKVLTTRERFIQHVRTYNLTQEPRRRFFLVGLSPGDAGFLNSLTPNSADNCVQESDALSGDIKQRVMSIATDGCLGPYLINPHGNEDQVAVAARSFLAEHQTLPATTPLPGASTTTKELVNTAGTSEKATVINVAAGTTFSDQTATAITGSALELKNGDSEWKNELKQSLETFMADKSRKVG